MTFFKNILFSLLTLLLPLSINAEIKAKKKKPTTSAAALQIKNTSPFFPISHEYMKGYVTDSLQENEEDLKAFEKKLRLAIPQIPAYTQYAKVYSLFSSVTVPESSVFNKNSWDDLELLVGEHNQAVNLMNLVDRTTTAFGRIYLSYMVATPIADITVLKKRQAIINEFATNKKLSTTISKLLTKVKAAENNFFFLWQEETDFNFKAINSYFFSSTLPGFKKLRHANTNPYLMELLCIKGRLLSAGIALAVPAIQFSINRAIKASQQRDVAFKAYQESTGYAQLEDELVKKGVLSKETYFVKKETVNGAWKTSYSSCPQEGYTKHTQTYLNEKFAINTLQPALKKSLEKASRSDLFWLFIMNGDKIPYTGPELINLIISHRNIAIPTVKYALGADSANLCKQQIDCYQTKFLSEALKDVSKQALQGVINQHTPFENVLKDIDLNKDNNTGPLEDAYKNGIRNNFTDLTLGDFHKFACAVDMKKPFYAGTAMGATIETLLIASAYSRESTYNKLTNYLHTQMLAAGTIIQAMQALATEIKKNPTLAANLAHSQHLSALFAKTDVSVSPKLRKLAQLLTSSTFKGQPSYFTLKGRVLAAYALMKEIKDELAPALVALGEVDALLSCTKLLKENSNESNHYTFATYIEQDTPYISMTNMWNPFVGSKKSVVNSIELGGKNPRNVILTGPNAGGKSTFSKGLTLNVVLAQTIGIVPAQSLTLTVFDKINTYMNITDDTAGGNSLFKSEVLRAQELLKTITSLDKTKFSFSVMDEMFSGTSPKEGEAASYAVAKNIGSQPNSIAVIATHFPRLKKLEEETTYFKNYQVRVVRHADGTFSYPFKLEEGVADQNVAIDILQQQGFDMSILSDAHAILNETTENK